METKEGAPFTEDRSTRTSGTARTLTNSRNHGAARRTLTVHLGRSPLAFNKTAGLDTLRRARQHRDRR